MDSASLDISAQDVRSVDLTDAFKTPLWKRTMDVVLAALLLILSIPVWLICYVSIRLTSRGPALHWSKRVGKGNIIFLMPKFRTMRVGAPQLPTHLMTCPSAYLTPMGSVLRRLSLDELPQLWSVLKGDLSLVGPRPALFNQDDLIALRTALGIHRMTPGITGWAQVNGRDELQIPAKVLYDAEYMKHLSFGFDLSILALTALKVFKAEGVQH